MLIAPNLGAEWLFDAARLYWDRFRPTVISDLEFLPFVPPGRTLTVTVVALRDTIAQIGVQLGQIAPQAYFDPILSSSFAETRDILNGRAERQQPFGTALATAPAPTPDPNAPFIPTPWLPTAVPVGTLTPTPTAPSATPVTPGSGPAPIQRTPGPVTGGD